MADITITDTEIIEAAVARVIARTDLQSQAVEAVRRAARNAVAAEIKSSIVDAVREAVAAEAPRLTEAINECLDVELARVKSRLVARAAELASE